FLITAMDLTPGQKEALETFRNRVSSKIPANYQHDNELLRWLVARNFKVDKAEEMLLKSLDWRREFDVDSVLKWEPPEVLLKYYPVGQVGHDKQGCPVWIIPFGGCDMRGLLHSVSKADYIRYTFRTLEISHVDMIKQTEIKGFPVTQQVCIFDMQNFSIKNVTWKPAMDVVLKLVQIYEANYPELLKCAYAINAPKIFTAAYAIIKPLLHEVTLKKIRIYGTSGWKEDLLKEIDADQLPQHWGGTKTDPDGNPKCQSLVCLGGEVPKELYQNINVGSKIHARDNFENVIVGKGGKKKIKLEVIQPGSQLKWGFHTEHHDIGFGVTRKWKDEEEILLPIQRVDSNLIMEEGSLHCTQPGTYIMIFDNSFSYVRTKKVSYSVYIEPPSTVSTTYL
ncbi:unnamed protein product, partial [Meganyctiphanes norvegica]